MREILGIETLCNGWCSPRKRYGKRKVEAIKRALPKVRLQLKSLINKSSRYEDEVYYGRRCQNDSDVICRMESTNQRKLKRKGLKKAILDALLDCASSDYYYEFEKDWG